MRGATLNGSVTWEQVAFFVALLGAISGVWWRIEGKVSEARAEAVKRADDAARAADAVARDLAAHKTHAAETFATKAGMQEQTTQIMRAIEGVGNRIDGVHERLDRMYENQAKPRSTRT